MSKTKGGKSKPTPTKMTCSAVHYKTIEVKPAIKADKEKKIKAEDAIMKTIIDPTSPCKREKVAGFISHLGRRHNGCKVQGIWERP